MVEAELSEISRAVKGGSGAGCSNSLLRGMEKSSTERVPYPSATLSASSHPLLAAQVCTSTIFTHQCYKHLGEIKLPLVGRGGDQVVPCSETKQMGQFAIHPAV